MLVRCFAVVAVASTLTSCPPSVHVTPSGSLQSGVVFRLSDGINGVEIPFDVISVTVCKKLSDPECIWIWDTHGQQRLQMIRYGAKYKGLSDKVRPEGLERGHRYDVDVVAKHPSTFLYGFGHFEIDEGGTVIDASQTH